MAEWSGGGGLGHYAYLLAEALAAQGIDVTHVTRAGHELSGVRRNHAERTVWPAAPRLPSGVRRKIVVGIGRLIGWLRFARIMVATRRERPIVHLQTLDHAAEIALALLCRALGGCVVVTVHNMRPHDAAPLHALTQTLGLRVPHGIVVHTEQAAEELRGSMRADARITILGHPSYRRLVELVGRPRPPAHQVPRVGAIGMIRPYKGLEVVVEAFRRVREDGTSCELRIAGRASDEAWVVSQLARLPAGSASSRLGYLPLPDFLDELLACDLLLLGHRSLSESGVAQLALGAGVAVVGPRLGALERLLEDRDDWLYEPGDADDAARRVGALLAERARDPDAIRAQALALSERAPSWHDMAGACLSLVDGLQT